VPPVVAAGHVWAGTEVIDPSTNHWAGQIPGGLGDVLTAVDGIPWETTTEGLVRIDPITYRRTRTFKVNANARKISDPDVDAADVDAAYVDAAFWVIVVGDATETFGGVVVKVDPRTSKVLHTYHPPDPGGYADIQFYQHAIWLKGDDSGRLVKLTPRPVPPGPTSWLPAPPRHHRARRWPRYRVHRASRPTPLGR
jgi:hypothetical protein